MEFIDEASIRLNVPLGCSPIKLAKTEHVDAFFRVGQIQLGTFEYYQKHENPQVHDEFEGFCRLIGYSDAFTVLVEASGGADQYVFCCAMTSNPKLAARRFGYDAAYEVLDPDGFQRAVSGKLKAIRERRAVCAYADHKAIAGEMNGTFRPDRISAATIDMLGAAKYFIKPRRFAHQTEYRFLWELDGPVEKPAIIECPEAVKFCRRMDWSKR